MPGSEARMQGTADLGLGWVVAAGVDVMAAGVESVFDMVGDKDEGG